MISELHSSLIHHDIEIKRNFLFISLPYRKILIIFPINSIDAR